MIIKQRGGYVAGFHVTFYSFFGENLGEYDTGNLAIGETREFKIPKNTYRVHVYVAIWAGNKKDIDFYADESAVNENSRIELTSEKTSKHPRFDVKINNGWSETAECPHRGIIQFNSVARGLFGGASFKATFYKDDQKLGEESLDLSNYLREAIKIPDNTNRIEAAISGAKWEWSSEIYDSATLKLDGNKATSMDVITINFGDRFRDWAPMEITCPNWWGRSESTKKMSSGTIQLNNNFVADHPRMYFKATFYRGAFGYNQKIDETRVKLLTSDELFWQKKDIPYSETFGIPVGTTSVKVEIIKEGKPIDSATFELRRDKTFSEDAIKIDLGYGDGRKGWWKSMEFNYPECWQKIK